MARIDASVVRTYGTLLFGVAGAIGLGGFLIRGYPLEEWLFVDLIVICGWNLLLTLACAAVGHFVLGLLMKDDELSPLGRLSLALPLGLVVFVTVMYLCGYLGLYGPVFATIMPLLLLAIGARSGIAAWKSYTFAVGAPTVPFVVGLVFGALCLGLIYLQLLSPDSLNYDSTWTHQVIAENYAREGRIIPFIGGWPLSVPNLASVVSAWGYMVPGLEKHMALRWMMALHLEFTVFLWTLIGVAGAVEYAVGERVRGAWAVYFLFPGIFVYDGSIGGSSDHYLALFVVPFCLAVALAARRFDARLCALAGAIGAGGLMTKLQAVYIIIPVAVLVAIAWGRLAVKAVRKTPEVPTLKQLALGALALALTGAVVASPHFIENWVYFNNPVYPLMMKVFTNTWPPFKDGPEIVRTTLADWHSHPNPDLAIRLKDSLRLIFTFSIDPHYSFYKNVPTFGSLFTLLTPIAFLVPGNRRILAAVFVGTGSVFCWAMNYLVDRHLQSLLPIMVVATAAVIFKAWQLGWPARAGLAAVVAVQLVWGADMMFSGNDRLANGVALIKTRYEGQGKTRYDRFRAEYISLGKSLPKDAVLLLHNHQTTLGFNRKVFFDWMGYSGFIDYRTMKSSREVYDYFKKFGITHIVDVPQHGLPTKQEEIVYNAFLKSARLIGQHGGFYVYEMPPTPPPEHAPYKVVSMGQNGYADGLYEISDFAVWEWGPPWQISFPSPRVPMTSPDQVTGLLAQADAAIITTSVTPPAEATQLLATQYQRVADYPPYRSIYVRPPGP